jgi:hypothetical protein
MSVLLCPLETAMLLKMVNALSSDIFFRISVIEGTAEEPFIAAFFYH